MTKKIQCLTKTETQSVKVKIIRAPLVDNTQLRRIIFARARAIIL